MKFDIDFISLYIVTPSTDHDWMMLRYYTCFDVHLTLYLLHVKEKENSAVFSSRTIFFSQKKKKIPTLKANSNLKQSKNKIRMLKEIKMLHNKIIQERKDEEALTAHKRNNRRV